MYYNAHRCICYIFDIICNQKSKCIFILAELAWRKVWMLIQWLPRVPWLYVTFLKCSNVWCILLGAVSSRVLNQVFDKQCGCWAHRLCGKRLKGKTGNVTTSEGTYVCMYGCIGIVLIWEALLCVWFLCVMFGDWWLYYLGTIMVEVFTPCKEVSNRLHWGSTKVGLKTGQDAIFMPVLDQIYTAKT